MRCPNCHTHYAEEDLYCRQCGKDLVEPSTDLVTTSSRLPAILQSQVPRSVAASVGALALGVGIELVRRNMLARLRPGRAVGHALPALSDLKDVLSPQSRKGVKIPKGYEIHETVVYMTRVIRRS